MMTEIEADVVQGKGHRLRNVGGFQAGKREKMDTSLEPPEGTQP